MDHYVQFKRPPKDCLTRWAPDHERYNLKCRRIVGKYVIILLCFLFHCILIAYVYFIHESFHLSIAWCIVCRFSGLRLEDLNINESRVWLTTRKAIMQKLRYLIDAGCMCVWTLRP